LTLPADSNLYKPHTVLSVHMVVKQSKAALLVKKKAWLPIISPGMFNSQPVGEIYIDEPARAVGRIVTVSLMTLTGDPQRQNTHVSFKITKVENNQLHTQLVGYSIIPVAVRKMMRRGRDRISDSFVAKTQDGIALRVKPVLITRGRTTGSVLTHVRRQLRASIVRALAKQSFADFAKDIIAHKFQRELQMQLSKIYPLQICELQDVHLETSEKGLKRVITAPQEPKPAEKPAEPVPDEAAKQEAPSESAETA
jgi:ribosomal protein S3AE